MQGKEYIALRPDPTTGCIPRIQKIITTSRYIFSTITNKRTKEYSGGHLFSLFKILKVFGIFRDSIKPSSSLIYTDVPYGAGKTAKQNCHFFQGNVPMGTLGVTKAKQ